MISLIVAMNEKRVIGIDNSIPWYLPEDLKLFKAKTTGNIIAMGRKTYESIGKPLPNRDNFIISRSGFEADGCETFSSPQECIDAAGERKLFFIGGGEIYSQVIDIVDELHISWIHNKLDGDTTFPEFDLEKWEEVEREDFEGFTYKRYARRS